MSNLESGKPTPPNEKDNELLVKTISLQKLSPEELSRIANCQIMAGREICLANRDDNGVIRSRIFDLRGVDDHSEEQTEKFKTGLIQIMSSSTIMIVVED